MQAVENGYPHNWRNIVLLVIALHCICYSLIALLTESTLPLDVIEQIGWSRDPQWVYFKHPPLPAWTLAAVLGVTQGWTGSASILGPVSTALTLWLVWLLARRMIEPARAAISVLLSEGIIYFNFESLEFNHNLIQLPLWALIAYTGHRAYREGNTFDWIFLGLAVTLGMLGKYSTALLMISLLAAFLFDKDARKKFRSFGPWLALATAAIGIAPHLIALERIGFTPFRFPLERARSGAGLIEHFSFPVEWLLVQLAYVSAALFLAFLLVGSRDDAIGLEPAAVAERDKRFVLVLFAGPLAISAAIQAAAGIRFLDMWGSPMWVLLGPALVLLSAAKTYSSASLARFTAGWIAIFLLGITATAVANAATPYFTHRGDRLHFPSAQMVKLIHERWQAEVGKRPLKIAIGDCWFSGLLAAYDPDHPSVMTDGEAQKSPWITDDRIRESGAVLLWSANETGKRSLRSWFPTARLQPRLVLAYVTGARVPPAKIDWAILPPGNDDRVVSRSELQRVPLTSPTDPCGRPPN